MTSRNPIDDLFRRRLEHYEQESPMHLWSAIAQSRPGADTPAPVTRRSYALVLALLLLLGFSGLLLWDPAPAGSYALGQFPIPVEKAAPSQPQASLAPPAPPAAAAPSSKRPAPVRALIAAPLPRPASLPKRQETDGQPIATSTPSADSPTARFDVPPLTVLPIPTAYSSSSLAQDRELQCVRFGNGGAWRLYADLTAGPTVGLRQLRARSNEFSDYADARRSTESPQLSYTAGLRFSLLTDFNVALRSGLQFTQFNEKFDYLDSNQEKITITTVYGSNGEIIGTDTLIEKSIRREVARNRYRMIDVPLLLGYEFQRGRWTFALNGGALVNLLFHAKGNFLDPDSLRPVAFSSAKSDDAPPYRTEIGLGWYAGLGLHYQLPNGLQLLLEPHLRYNPNSVTRDAYGLEQRYFAGGLSVGLRKQI